MVNEDYLKIKRLAVALFQQSPYPTLLWTPDLRIEDVNEPLLKLTGYDRTHVLSMVLKDFRILSSTGEGFNEVKRTRNSVRGEAEFDFPSGKKIVERHVIPLLDNSGEIENILTIYRDMTLEREELKIIDESRAKASKIRQYMEEEINKAYQVYQRVVTENDMTIRFEFTPPDNDTQDTYNCLIKLKGAILHIIQELQDTIISENFQMEKLISTTKEAANSIKDASKAISQIASNIGGVSEQAEKSSNGAEQISKVMQDMSAAVEEITSSMNSISNLSNQTNDLSSEGKKLAERAEQSMFGISQSSDKVYEIVTDVESQMAEISKIVVLIRDIANQTNLLALNAAIEAARAGDAGRGFAVVATEVKSLAQESRKSAEKIEEMINNLRIGTQNASSAVDETKKTIEIGEKMVTETVKTFANIASSIEEIARNAAEIAAATEEQAATTEEITAGVTDITQLVEKTAKEAADAAAASEEISAAIDEIHNMATMVNNIALEVIKTNQKFKVQ